MKNHHTDPNIVQEGRILSITVLTSPEVLFEWSEQILTGAKCVSKGCNNNFLGGVGGVIW